MSSRTELDQLSRRGLFRLGGAAAGLAALLAACGDDVTEDSPSRVGSLPTTTALPEGVRTDGVLFRTAASIHYSIIDAHSFALNNGDLSSDQADFVKALIAANDLAIATLAEWTTTAGSEPWTCANPRFNRVILTPIFDRITGRPRRGVEAADIPPTDDPNRDCMALVYSMETLAGEMHQSFVPILSTGEYRNAVMLLGSEAARRSAVAALAINPDNLINPTAVVSANPDAPVDATLDATTTTQDIAQPEGDATTTTVPTISSPQQYYAVPSQFGLLGPVQLSVGYPTAGSQFTINIETPSINSYAYDYQSCDDTEP